MPKFIDKYIIQQTKPIMINQMEHYEAKQRETNTDFVLKRVKNPKFNQSSTTSLRSIPQCQLGQFQQLTNQTSILKLLDHKSIPKCLRILKTSNSVYFVYENYPLLSLEQYLKKNDSNFQTKVKISINIITTLDYIHKQSVVYRGINGKNVKIDGQLNVYLTSFTQARSYQNFDQKFKSLNQAKKQRQFKSLVNEDFLDLAALLLKIFNLDNINPKLHIFSNEKQRILYEVLTQGLQKKINFITLQNLFNILTDKETLKTKACTSTTSSFYSINIKDPRKSEKFKTSRELYPLNLNLRKSQSSVNLSMRTSQNKENTSRLLRSKRNIQPNQSKNCLIVSTSNLNKSERLSWSDQLNSVVQKLQREKSRERQSVKKQISQILTTRKIINLILHCMKSLNKQSSVNVLLLMALKCEFLTMREQKQLEICLLQQITNEQRQALKQIKKQNIRTIITLQIVKQSVKELLAKHPNFQQSQQSSIFQFIKSQKICQQKVQQKLSSEISSYLQKEMSLLCQNKQLLSDISDNKNKQKVDSGLYEKVRHFYYLTIKLKYKSFQEFFDKKDNFQTQQMSVLKDEYFLYFEACQIPLYKIVNQVKFRMETFQKTFSRVPSRTSI